VRTAEKSEELYITTAIPGKELAGLRADKG
jgi:hypothetical protein